MFDRVCAIEFQLKRATVEPPPIPVLSSPSVTYFLNIFSVVQGSSFVTLASTSMLLNASPSGKMTDSTDSLPSAVSALVTLRHQALSNAS